MLQRIFIFLLLLLVLPDLYLYFKHIVYWTAKRWIRIAYWVPTLLILLGMAYISVYANSDFYERNPQAVGWFSIFFFLFAAPKLVLTLCTLIGIPFHKFFRCPRTPFLYTGLVLALSNVLVILYGSFVGRTQFEVNEVTFTSAKLPKGFDGYRIVQISDIHIGSWKGNIPAIEKMVHTVNAQRPDLIVFTGDLVNNRALELDEFEQTLAQLKAKDGVYAVLGNHDYGPYYHWKSKREMEENFRELKVKQKAMGWKLLNNEHVMLHHAHDSIALIGVENEGEPPFSQHGDLTKASRGTEGMFQLLLSHNPSHWRREVLPQTDIDLMLAGHTHGMQLQFGDFSPASLRYPEWGGLYQEGSQALYVNLGVGYVGLPFRFGAWPEVTVFTLRR